MADSAKTSASRRARAPISEWLLLASVLMLPPSVARAQADGALDMGMVTMDAALSHVQQSEEARARHVTPAPPSAVIARSLAAQLNTSPAAAPATAVFARYRPSEAVRATIAGRLADTAERRTAGTAAEMRKLVLSGRSPDQNRADR